MKIDLIVGARPNFMKAAPLYHALQNHPELFEVRLIHTGQHYDRKMSRIFFEELGLPKPDVYLGVGSGSHAEQTGAVMTEYEKLLIDDPVDLVLVVGDVNSTLACSLVAKKLHIKLGHIEAGLRSFDRRMPEEINRLVTDSVADYLFTTSRDADEHLKKEGHSENSIFFVGNLMIDSLEEFLPRADCSNLLDSLEIESGEYGLITLHRPSNVDDEEIFTGILEAFQEIQGELPLIFPAHPRTKQRIHELTASGALESMPGLHIIDPVGYLEFIGLERDAKIILTDSGGIQEESTVLGVPCLTLRENTERPVTVEVGTNRLVHPAKDEILDAVRAALDAAESSGEIPEYWDGHAAGRIVDILIEVNALIDESNASTLNS
ncbi:MAG: UDP-N-acetylglucosamine 2-epimerase (non-hydrolyzing) [Candidatus Marinimicrobia bacterium]|nr:UDP-N-acetylglucosamine 2-epimerase (non-hydrolyzing) [Candidatus Neomarinimicrobiota bacterium]MCF7828794.1 UDP-N-acetylglucosamine 2-epimerase (non-hydrolyzing) [Candidatus Neomarinimicrobiota bacterium]MCF7880711.1 UDP-N-acetylglucosamine 2-epimerase (non-hydrolyzing) [Candidatus Neomarinimicrobiota bacterium]